MALILFFAIGVVEMFIVSLWTKFVSTSKMLASGVVTFINTLMYFYILEALLENVSNTPLIVAYALGCAVGTMLVAALPVLVRLLKRDVLKNKTQRGEQFSPISNEPELVV